MCVCYVGLCHVGSDTCMMSRSYRDQSTVNTWISWWGNNTWCPGSSPRHPSISTPLLLGFLPVHHPKHHVKWPINQTNKHTNEHKQTRAQQDRWTLTLDRFPRFFVSFSKPSSFALCSAWNKRSNLRLDNLSILLSFSSYYRRRAHTETGNNAICCDHPSGVSWRNWVNGQPLECSRCVVQNQSINIRIHNDQESETC